MRYGRAAPKLSEGGKARTTSGPDFDTRAGQAAFRALADRLRAYFLTQDGKPRGERFSGTVFRAAHCDSEAAWKQHRAARRPSRRRLPHAVNAFRRDSPTSSCHAASGGCFAVTTAQYRHALDARALLDFSGVLERAVDLLKQMDEFARSRYAWSRATTTCSSTSFRTRAGRNGIWWSS